MWWKCGDWALHFPVVAGDIWLQKCFELFFIKPFLGWHFFPQKMGETLLFSRCLSLWVGMLFSKFMLFLIVQNLDAYWKCSDFIWCRDCWQLVCFALWTYWRCGNAKGSITGLSSKPFELLSWSYLNMVEISVVFQMIVDTQVRTLLLAGNDWALSLISKDMTRIVIVQITRM